MIKRARYLAIAFAVLLAANPVAQAQDARPAADAAVEAKPVVVFAAASLKTALDRIIADWRIKTGKHATASYAASSALAKQIEAGAPADVFLSADLRWMDWLEERKLIASGSRKTLLGNALVLIAPKSSDVEIEIEPGFALAEKLGEGRIAMGETSSVPAGTYGKAALEHLGVWNDVAPKVAGAENVRVALAYVARGETPLGIVYATDARSEPNVRIVNTFPSDSHAPIVYPLARTAASTNADASAFTEFLGSPEAAAVFEQSGFTVIK